MLKGFLGTFLKLTDPSPRYTGERCLVERQAVGGCDRCMAACPHEAVRITDRVEILDDACTGCGLCVQACPSGALEYDLVPVLGALKDQGTGGGGEPAPAVLKCSKVPGDGATVECLARLSPAEVMASAAWNQRLTLVRGDCDSCKLGGPSVPESVGSVLQIAAEYRKNLPGFVPPPRLVKYGEGAQAAPVEVAAPVPQAGVSRREAMGSLFGTARRTAARAIPDRPLPGVSAELEAAPVPEEWVWRRRTLRPRPAEGALQYWPAPVVDEKCIMCPVCANVCPTNAISRTLDEAGVSTLRLELAACTGCNACVASCPPYAMTLEPFWPASELGETVVLREGDPYR